MVMSASVTLKGMPVSLQGALPKVGDVAPEFAAVGANLAEVKLSSFAGKRVLLNVFPSLDTEVCAMSVRKFNQRVSEMKDVQVLALSMDLPFAQSRFCTVEGIERVMPLSVFRSETFAKGYGLRMTDGPLAGLMARAVVVIGEDGRVAYTELVPDITQEPNYDAAIEVLTKQAGV